MKSGWQLLRYYYRIDNDPSVSIEFAKTMMRKERGDDVPISVEKFTRFPVRGNFPGWFDPDSITDGVLVRGDDWI
jgi:hypothetical protein